MFPEGRETVINEAITSEPEREGPRGVRGEHGKVCPPGNHHHRRIDEGPFNMEAQA